MKLNIFFINLLLVIFLFIGLNCTKNTSPFPEKITEYKTALIPSYPGNQWTYVDTTFVPNLIIEQYTVKIDAFTNKESELWWKLNFSWATASLRDLYTIQNNSVFIEYWEAAIPSEAENSMQFLIPSDDTATFILLGSSETRTAAKLYEPVKINGIIYDNCILFKTESDEYIICPGIGILSRTWGIDFPIRKAVLLDYQIAK